MDDDQIEVSDGKSRFDDDKSEFGEGETRFDEHHNEFGDDQAELAELERGDGWRGKFTAEAHRTLWFAAEPGGAGLPVGQIGRAHV